MNSEVCTPTLFESHSTPICLSLNFFRILLHTFLGFVLAIGTFFAMFDTSSRVTSPKSFWVGKPSPNTFDKGAHILLGICPTQICMIRNLFRTQLYISLGFVLAICDIFGHF